MNLITDAIKELERLERVEEYNFKETIELLHQANKAQNKALFIPRVVLQSEQLHKCDVDKIGNEYKCIICGKISETKF